MKEASFSDRLPYRSFLPDYLGVVDLRGEGILQGFRAAGPSPEIEDASNLESYAQQLGRAMRHLGTGDAVWAIFHRSLAPTPPSPTFDQRAAQLVYADLRAQYDNQHHWICPSELYLAYRYRAPITSWFEALLMSADAPGRHIRYDLLRDRALQRFLSFRDATSAAVALTPMSNQELFDALGRCTTYHEERFALPEPHVRLNDVLACERWHGGTKPYVNGWHLRPISIMTYPAATVPQMLAVLLQQTGHMTVCVRYLCRDAYDAQKDFAQEKKHWNRTFIDGLKKVLRRYMRSDSAEADRDAIEQIAGIDEAHKQSMQGMSFGRVTTTVIIRDQDSDLADERAHEHVRECHAMGIMARIEDHNAPLAVQGTWPGQYAANRRKVLVNGVNFADLVLPATYWQGTPYIDSEHYPKNTPVPLVCGGGGERPPFYWPSHINGVANQLVIGPIGMGKSTLEQLLACMYLSVPNSRVFILDVGYSSHVFTHLMNGEYHDVGAEDGIPLSPLAMLDREGGAQWLSGWFERMFAKQPGIYGLGKFELDERAREDFKSALRGLAGDKTKRSLNDLRAKIYGGDQGGRDRIRRILEEYITDYGHIFGGEGTFNPQTRLTTFDVQALMGLPDHISTPAMELLLQFIFSGLDGNPTWIMVDEFWNLLGDPASALWLNRAIRTFRRRNAGFIGFTQSTVELADSQHCNLFLESCPSLIFLPNHRAGSEYIAQAYRKLGLGTHEICSIASAKPHADYFFNCALGSRLVRLELGSVTQAICASTKYSDVKAFRALLNEWDNNQVLNQWLSKILSDNGSGGSLSSPRQTATDTAIHDGYADATVDTR